MSTPSEKKKKRQARLATLFQIGVMLGIGVACGLYTAIREDALPISRFPWDMLYLFATIFIAFYLQIILHESGHLIAGLLSGYRFLSFRIASLTLIRKGGRLKFGFYKLPGTGGQCLLLPPENWQEGNFPVTFYNMGGVIINLLVTAIAMPFAFLPHVPDALAGFAFFVALAGIYTVLVNSIPLPGMILLNDGKNTALLRQSAAARRSFAISLLAVDKAVEDEEIPDEWLALPTEAEMQNPLATTVAVNACDCLIRQCRFADAITEIRALLAAPVALTDFHRQYLTLQLVFCLLIEGAPRSEVEALLTKAQKNFHLMLSPTLDGITVSYALAQLYDNDPKAAAQAEMRFAKLARRYPYAGDLAAGERVMDHIKTRAAEIAAERSAIPDVQSWGDHT